MTTFQTTPADEMKSIEKALKVDKSKSIDDKIAILDCGAQYTKVIDRRVREMKVFTEIFPLDVDPQKLQGFSGIIISGGPGSVYEPGAPMCSAELFKLGVPVLGICYGMQLMTSLLGGKVVPGKTKEYGETEIHIDSSVLLFEGLGKTQQVLMSHGDRVECLAPGFRVVGESHDVAKGEAPVLAAIADSERQFYGVQFHPEVDLTENGSALLNNFLYEVCEVQGTFDLENRLESLVQEIQEKVGGRDVFVLVSGGVDSSVTAALLLKALSPEQVYAVHIDSGMMRHRESAAVFESLKSIGLKHYRQMDAADDFFNGVSNIDGRQVGPLKTLVEPEEKRGVIGDVFYKLINQAMAEAECDLDNSFIAQGTLRPDLIESGNRDVSATAHKIKTHHNDVPAIRAHRERGLIIEPNRDMHKDEVREVGRMLGLSEELVSRQPFPGPGLGIRVLCADKPYITEVFDETNEKLKSQAAAVGFNALLLPTKSVGVQGDGRSYSYLSLLASEDWSDWSCLKSLAQSIPNQLHSINRVALCLNKVVLPKSYRVITPTHLTLDSTELLRGFDHQVSEAFKAAGLFEQISQLFTVLVPIDLSGGQGHSLAIRAVMTSDYMTARPAMVGKELPIDFLKALGEKLAAQPGIDTVMYDVTSKPPATVEWE